jgi:hypothetical protein
MKSLVVVQEVIERTPAFTEPDKAKEATLIRQPLYFSMIVKGI